ncbi:restriction endonuclease subunit S [Tenacibaculum finnmarkense]|uniref:restriction endonuclease subunit S n=1 Tax=Tenacibaculum finnmarkense TaxID=2781243 RepID=UPI003BB60889
MELVELSKVCDLKNGFAFKSKDYVEISDTLSCRMSSIRPGGYFDLHHNKRFLPNKFINLYSDYLLKDGDIVIAMTDLAGDPKILGVPTIVKTEGKFLLQNQRVGKLIIKDDKQVFVPYLQYALNRSENKSYYKKFASGGLQINIGKKEILGNKIPLPSLEIQKKIASILEQADKIRQLNKQLIDKYDALTQSLFLEMFGDLLTNTKNWEVKVLGEICKIGSGKRVFVKELVDSGIPFYRGTEIGGLSVGKKIKPKLFITKKHYEELKKQTGVPKIGDLLMPSICPDGRIFEVSNDNPFYFKDGRVLWIQIEKELINNVYLKFFLREIFRVNYHNIASGTTFAELKIFALKKLKTLFPPLKLQNQFSERVKIIENQKKQAEASLQKSEDLFNSLLQKAFKGALFKE